MRVLIVAASPEPILDLPKDMEFVIGVDGGYQTLLDKGIKPDLIVGDFDSFKGEVPDEALRYPSEKDMTDLEIALGVARENGATTIEVYGALGGRIDMTLGNIGLLEAYPEMKLHAEGQEVHLVKPGKYEIERKDGYYLSFVPWKSATISIRGVKYPLNHREVFSHEALTISNEWSEDEAELIVHQGTILIMTIKK